MMSLLSRFHHRKRMRESEWRISLDLSHVVIPGWPEGPDPESIFQHDARPDGFRVRATHAPE